jgi:hypothetical protein
MSYIMDLMKAEDIDENDTIVELDDNKRCFIDPKSLMFLYGMQLDYSDELIGGGCAPPSRVPCAQEHAPSQPLSASSHHATASASPTPTPRRRADAGNRTLPPPRPCTCLVSTGH